MTRCIELVILSALIHFASYSEQSRKLYSYLKRYNLQNNDPNKFCEGYICEQSGLTELTVTGMLNIDNTLRNSYALSRNISNLYMLVTQEWYPVLQYWAQDKANLCLPPTEDEFYDFAVIQKYGIPKHDAEYNDACQVVITSQPTAAKDTTPQQMKERITDYIYQNRLHHFERLGGNRWGLTRKQVSQVGCGYVLRLNETHYIDHLVCLYCVFRFKKKRVYYTTMKGAPCTNCNYYKTEYPWRCGKGFQHLCVASVTNENQKPQIIKKICPKEVSLVKTKSKKTRFINFEKLILPIEAEVHYHHQLKPLQEAGMKKSAHEFLQFTNVSNEKDRSLMDDTAKAKRFSYRAFSRKAHDCNFCIFLLVFAACLTCVSLLVASYVVYVLKKDQNETKQIRI